MITDLVSALMRADTAVSWGLSLAQNPPNGLFRTLRRVFSDWMAWSLSIIAPLATMSTMDSNRPRRRGAWERQESFALARIEDCSSGSLTKGPASPMLSCLYTVYSN